MNNELINIINKEGTMVVSSREVAENFEKQHKHVLEKIEELVRAEKSALIGKYFIPSEYRAGTGKNYKEYLLTRDGFSLLVMGFTGTKALEWKLKYIDAFNKMEKVITQGLPLTYKEALQQLIEKEEAKEKLQLAYEEMKPKAMFAEAVESSKTSILVGDMAKILKQNGIDIGQNRFFEYLRQNGYLCNKKGDMYNTPTQRSMDSGLFEIKETTIHNPDGSITIRKTPKVTGKGQTYFVNKLLNVN